MRIATALPTRDIFNLHSHSRFSSGDALPQVKDMVKTVADMGQPALGLTDHGNMAGSVQLYKECRKAGILPFPGTELYVVRDRGDKKAKRHHMCVAAYTTKGYENLVGLSTLSHKNFHNKPLIDHSDLATLSEQGLLAGLVGTSGCYFGYISQSLDKGDFADAEALMKAYSGWFKNSNGLFVTELQNHNIDHDNGHDDDVLAGYLWNLSEALSIPVILTQDSHYCHEHDKPVHEALKRIVSFGPEPEDAVFPGDGFHLASAEWFQEHHHKDRYMAGYEGLGDLLDLHDLHIKELDNYSYNIPFTVDEPDRTLANDCWEQFRLRELSEEHRLRLAEELSIIHDTGMAGYILMVRSVTDHCRDENIYFQARGSASGSMVCWLMDITQVDPLKWGISFERFISRDRMKPPDIDIDVEHHRRQEIIDWLEGRYAVHQIGTWGTYSIAGTEEESTGSLRVKYFARQRAVGAPIDSWDDVPSIDKEMMRQIAAFKTTSHPGVHAAGIVLDTVQADFERLIPLMYIASSKTFGTQYSMKDVEDLGKVKLDLLGVKTLSVIHKCLDNLGKDFRDGLDWIPLNDKRTFQEISQGNTDGVFQLEGWASRRGCRDLKPTKVTDVIAAMALFRPATMKSGATEAYIKRRARIEEVPYRHHVIDKSTKDTYGIMLFQEQVISILRSLKMSPEDLTLFLKAVKSSNDNVEWASGIIEKFRPQVHSTALEMSFTENDWVWLWNAIEGFGEYGFNLAHSTVYGLTAYRTAYLSTNHQLQFFAALLNVFAGSSKQGKEKKSKEDIYLLAAKQRGIRLLIADVNLSGTSYEVDPSKNGIRRGLMGVKGIGEKAAEEIVRKRPEGGYESLGQLCRLVDRKKITGAKAYIESGDTGVGIIRILNENGALDDLLLHEADRKAESA